MEANDGGKWNIVENTYNRDTGYDSQKKSLKTSLYSPNHVLIAPNIYILLWFFLRKVTMYPRYKSWKNSSSYLIIFVVKSYMRFRDNGLLITKKWIILYSWEWTSRPKYIMYHKTHFLSICETSKWCPTLLKATCFI